MTPIQPDLMEAANPLYLQTLAWIETPRGRVALDRFCAIALGCRTRGIRVGAKAIWERMRWNFMLRRLEGEEYLLNNNFASYIARIAVAREPLLSDFFEFRATRAGRDADGGSGKVA